MSVCCMFVPSQKNQFPVDWRLLLEYCIVHIPLDLFYCWFFFNDFLHFEFLCVCFWSLQTRLLCIMLELAGRGSDVAVALVTGDKWHMTHDTWHMTCDMWHIFFNLIIPPPSPCLSVRFSYGATIRTTNFSAMEFCLYPRQPDLRWKNILTILMYSQAPQAPIY